MKKSYIAPKLTVHGSVESLTQQTLKEFGGDDGIALIIPGVPDPVGIS